MFFFNVGLHFFDYRQLLEIVTLMLPASISVHNYPTSIVDFAKDFLPIQVENSSFDFFFPDKTGWF
jgi:hypothetical protein